MGAQPGDRIVLDSGKVGQRTREGEILEVIPSPTGTAHYLVRWDDGHESDIRPAAGSATIFHTTPTAPDESTSAG